MTRKPLSPEAKAAARALIDQHIRSFCEWSEQRKGESYGIGPCVVHDLPLIKAENERMKLANLAREHAGVLAALDEQPREA